MLTYQGSPIRDQFETVGDKVYLRLANICPCAQKRCRVGHGLSQYLEARPRRVLGPG